MGTIDTSGIQITTEEYQRLHRAVATAHAVALQQPEYSSDIAAMDMRLALDGLMQADRIIAVMVHAALWLAHIDAERREQAATELAKLKEVVLRLSGEQKEGQA